MGADQNLQIAFLNNSKKYVENIRNRKQGLSIFISIFIITRDSQSNKNGSLLWKIKLRWKLFSKANMTVLLRNQY